jgi:hypothetical protein
MHIRDIRCHQFPLLLLLFESFVVLEDINVSMFILQDFSVLRITMHSNRQPDEALAIIVNDVIV